MEPFEASIVAETRTIEEYLESLANGTSDFFCCYEHASFPFSLDPAEYEGIDIGIDRMSPYWPSSLPAPEPSSDTQRTPIPFLGFSGTAFMSRVVESIIMVAPFRQRLNTVYRSSLAESLSTAASRGLGLAWLPESVGSASEKLTSLRSTSGDWASYSSEMTIKVYKSSSNDRPVVNEIWNLLNTRSANYQAQRA